MKNKISYYRKLNGFSQVDLGRALNVSGATVSSWEQDRTEPNMEQSLKLAKLFGCTLEELFGSPQIEPDFVYSSEEKQLILEYRNADNDTKNMINRLLHYYELLKKGE